MWICVTIHILSSLRSCTALNKAFEAIVFLQSLHRCKDPNVERWSFLKDPHIFPLPNPSIIKTTEVGLNGMPSTCPYVLAVLDQPIFIILQASESEPPL